MGIFKRLGTIAVGMANAFNPFGIGLLTATGMINRTETELKLGKDLLSAIATAIQTSSAKYVSGDAKMAFYEEIKGSIEAGEATFFEIVLGWTMIAYSDHVKQGKFWE